MSFFKRLFGRAPEPKQITTVVEVRLDQRAPDLVPVSGMMTVAKKEARRFAARRGLAAEGYAEVDATLRAEPTNTVDRNAVAIVVDGERVGYVPGWTAPLLSLRRSEARGCVVQVFTAQIDRDVRIEGWVWLGTGSPQWQWSASNRPPMSAADKREAAKRSTDKMVNDALAGGGERAADFRAGMVDAQHYLQLVEPIKQLKREGRLTEALALCYQAIEGAERSARREHLTPPPFYTEQAAIIHRKLGQRDEEIAVLRRYLVARPSGQMGGRIQERLDKLIGA